jgi:elongation factor Ts
VEILCETDFVAKNEEFKEFAHDIALHIAASAPKYVKNSDIPEEELSSEKKILEEEVKASGKSSEIIEKIVLGKLEKYYSEVCLLNQPFVKNPEKTIEDLLTEKVAKIGENIIISRFVRFEIGE